VLQQTDGPTAGGGPEPKARTSSWRWTLAVTAAVLALAPALAACGDDDSDSAATAAGSGSKSTESAPSVPDPITSPPDKIAITKPWTSPPPTGKTIFWLQCELPICAKIAQGGKAAAAAIGWKFESVVFKAGNPAGGMQTALQRKPDAIFISGIPAAAIKSQLAAAEKAGIPVVGCGDPEQPGPGKYASMCGTTTGPDGEQLGLWAIKDSGGDAHVVSVTIPSFPSLTTTTDGTAKAVKQYCPKCSADILPVTVDDLGAGQVASKLVAYLQAHPDVNYVLFTFADLGAGVAAALKGAGLDSKVKLIGNGAGPTQFKTMVAGGTPDAAWMAYPAVLSGWIATDAAARLIADGKLPDGYQKEQDHLQTWIVDSAESAKSLAPSYDWEGPTNYQQQFKDLWKAAG
jgi:ribose transport system substrate-binding protein